MNCYYHKNAPASGACVKCGKALCNNCIDLIGSGLCKKCLRAFNYEAEKQKKPKQDSKLSNTTFSEITQENYDFKPLINIILSALIILIFAITGYQKSFDSEFFIQTEPHILTLIFAYLGLALYYGFILFLKIFKNNRFSSTIILLIVLSPFWILYSFFCIILSLFGCLVMFFLDLLKAFKLSFKLIFA